MGVSTRTFAPIAPRPGSAGQAPPGGRRRLQAPGDLTELTVSVVPTPGNVRWRHACMCFLKVKGSVCHSRHRAHAQQCVLEHACATHELLACMHLGTCMACLLAKFKAGALLVLMHIASRVFHAQLLATLWHKSRGTCGA